MPTSLDEDSDLLTAAMRAAGRTAMRYFRRDPRRRRKPDGTEVSEADLAVNADLHAALVGPRPAYGWLSEESPDDAARLACERIWTVDPIDGTRAFLAELPEWAICAGLVENGRPVLGIVYNPATDEFFHAVEGAGARLNGAPISASARSDMADAALIVSGGFVRRKDWDRPWPRLRTRWINSVAYRLALVASGAYDATVSLSGKSDWDLAAAHILVQEAGGRITTHRGAAIVYNRPEPVHCSVVAAGPALHADLVDRMRVLALK